MTEQQQAFVRAYVENGGNATAAAREAGYSADRSAAYSVPRLPHVQAAIRDELERCLAGGNALALRTLDLVMRDDGAPASAKVAAARARLEAGRMLGGARAPEPQDDKPLAEMTPEELQRFIEAEEAALATLKGAIPATIDGQSEPVPPGIPPGSVVTDVDEQGNPRLPASASAV